MRVSNVILAATAIFCGGLQAPTQPRTNCRLFAAVSMHPARHLL